WSDVLATAEPHTLSLHAALPIYRQPGKAIVQQAFGGGQVLAAYQFEGDGRQTGDGGDAHRKQHQPGIFIFDLGDALDVLGLGARSEEHTSELQSRENLVCRLLLE